MHKMLLELSAKLETERLILRPYQAGDGLLFYKMLKENREHLRELLDPISKSNEQFPIPTDYTASGTEIGLYLSQEIIKAHGGTITAQSPGKGRGSTFTINIPLKTD